MATRIQLNRRLTHTYRDGWAYLDRHVVLCGAKVLQPRLLDVGNGYDEGPRFRYKAILDVGINSKVGMSALNEYFRDLFTSRCTHEHDCCGCSFASVNVKRMRGREYSVSLRVMKNY